MRWLPRPSAVRLAGRPTTHPDSRMKTKADTSLLFFVLGLTAAVAALYWTGLGNALVFDDERLRDGTIFGQYGSLAEFRVRLLSYGSFVWVQDLFGAGWWKQRVVNVALHLGAALSIYGLLQQLLERTEFPASERAAAHFESSRTLALRIGVALFALNPVAVYAVAYLVQRSVVMATMLVALGCASFVKGLVTQRKAWIGAALGCYVLAVLAKEHAVTAVALAVPLYVFVRRPAPRRILAVSAVSALILLAVAAILYRLYGDIVGTVFDETSRAYVQQLEQLSPGIGGRLYLLSIVNQATRFFQYGLLWFIPVVTQMSIDIRPEFPLTAWGWPQTAAALGYVAVLAGSAWLVIRRSDALGLAALCVLAPALLFVTEFATVWVQDPFVLYRSYLWALTMPALVALPLIGLKRNVLAMIGVVLACLFAGLAFERLLSLRDASSAWSDAAAKVDPKAGAGAVGRWRPFLNLGAEQLERGANETAYANFAQAEALGEPLGSARYSMGLALQQMKQHARALDEFAKAEAKGFTEAALYFHRGESQYATGRFAEAYASYGAALGKPQAESAVQHTRLRRAETAVAVREFDTAIADYRALLASQPNNSRYLVGLSMAHIGKQDVAAARAILDPLLEKQPSGPAYFARALAFYFSGDPAASRKDLEMAMRAEPGNAQYRSLRDRLDAERGGAAGSVPKR
jgi:tetratricopeptide (TPR) repeat protein